MECQLPASIKNDVIRMRAMTYFISRNTSILVFIILSAYRLTISTLPLPSCLPCSCQPLIRNECDVESFVSVCNSRSIEQTVIIIRAIAASFLLS